MCGFGNKDYRAVDPAPILQLVRKVDEQILTEHTSIWTSVVCHASLWSEDGTEERSIVINPAHLNKKRPELLFHEGSTASGNTSETGSSTTWINVGAGMGGGAGGSVGRMTSPTGSTMSGGGGGGAEPPPYVQVMVGTLVSPCHVLTDVDGVKGMFFTFTELSIRTPGRFRLKFSVYEITKPTSTALSTAITNVITVYTPKSFPGMTVEATPLAKCLARQGVKLHIRSDLRRHSVGGDEKGKK
ncbi:hypothetical protein HK104_003577, partial [Borealophlyctis nickersoniae]